MKLDNPFCFEDGKESYPDEAEAKEALRSYARKGHHRSRQLPTGAYECRHGNGWHLTSSIALSRRYRRSR
jgi:hypothetical protein